MIGITEPGFPLLPTITKTKIDAINAAMVSFAKACDAVCDEVQSAAKVFFEAAGGMMLMNALLDVMNPNRVHARRKVRKRVARARRNHLRQPLQSSSAQSLGSGSSAYSGLLLADF